MLTNWLLVSPSSGVYFQFHVYVSAVRYAAIVVNAAVLRRAFRSVSFKQVMPLLQRVMLFGKPAITLLLQLFDQREIPDFTIRP